SSCAHQDLAFNAKCAPCIAQFPIASSCSGFALGLSRAPPFPSFFLIKPRRVFHANLVRTIFSLSAPPGGVCLFERKSGGDVAGRRSGGRASPTGQWRKSE